jgi:ABC-type bacteriocin/lantibiotic exporter with double-glycine peptidase domain
VRLPGRNLIGVDVKMLGQLSNRSVALNGRRCHLRLEGRCGADVELVGGTFVDNMAREDAAMDDIIEAARVAGVKVFVLPLEDGFDAWIGQHGLSFSGGQCQRLGLARANLRDPQVLILDEAMSELDRDLEDQIRNAIEGRLKGRTLLLITHRIETVRSADYMVCIEKGRVVSSGSPQQVLNDPTGLPAHTRSGIVGHDD